MAPLANLCVYHMRAVTTGAVVRKVGGGEDEHTFEVLLSLYLPIYLQLHFIGT